MARPRLHWDLRMHCSNPSQLTALLDNLTSDLLPTPFPLIHVTRHAHAYMDQVTHTGQIDDT
jgi:hypothetical protein